MKACVFTGNRIVVPKDGSGLPSLDLATAWLPGDLDWFEPGGASAYVRGVETPEGWELPEEAVALSLRAALTVLDEHEVRHALTASHIRRWHKSSRFCGACGNATKLGDGGRAFECPRCSHLMFPKVSPAVIVQVTKESEILLGRSRRHPPGLYSVLAGFVDPGESLEEAVIREIREESGVTVRDVTYFGSQHWPFPDSLMVGFTAVYERGELTLEDDEIEDVGWFSADRLPPVPPGYSIARALIDDFARRHGVDPKTVPTWYQSPTQRSRADERRPAAGAGETHVLPDPDPTRQESPS